MSSRPALRSMVNVENLDRLLAHFIDHDVRPARKDKLASASYAAGAATIWERIQSVSGVEKRLSHVMRRRRIISANKADDLSQILGSRASPPNDRAASNCST